MSPLNNTQSSVPVAPLFPKEIGRHIFPKETYADNGRALLSAIHAAKEQDPEYIKIHGAALLSDPSSQLHKFLVALAILSEGKSNNNGYVHAISFLLSIDKDSVNSLIKQASLIIILPNDIPQALSILDSYRNAFQGALSSTQLTIH